MKLDFSSLNINITTILISVYFIVIMVMYYVLFHKHHKRNGIGFDEILSLISNYFVTTTVSVILLGVGVYVFLDTFNYLDERNEIIVHIFVAFLIFIIDIYNYIIYIKRKLTDYEVSDRVINKNSVLKAGEVLEFILFILVALVPLFRINYFISITDKSLLTSELFKYIGLSVASIFILFNLNPLDFRHGFKNCILKKEVSEKNMEAEKETIENKKAEVEKIIKSEKTKVKDDIDKKVNKNEKNSEVKSKTKTNTKANSKSKSKTSKKIEK